MERRKWLSIPIASAYIIFFLWPLVFGDREDDLSMESLFESIIGMLFWLALCLGCIWYADELGEGLVGARYGLISSSSPGWAVELMGWILLSLPAFIALLGIPGTP
jgi:hypothetical protein